LSLETRAIKNKADREEDAHAAIVNGCLFAGIRCTGNDTSVWCGPKQSLADSGQTCHNCNEGTNEHNIKESKEVDAKV